MDGLYLFAQLLIVSFIAHDTEFCFLIFHRLHLYQDGDDDEDEVEDDEILGEDGQEDGSGDEDDPNADVQESRQAYLTRLSRGEISELSSSSDEDDDSDGSDSDAEAQADDSDSGTWWYARCSEVLFAFTLRKHGRWMKWAWNVYPILKIISVMSLRPGI